MQFAMAGQDQRVLCIKRGIAVSRCPLAGCKIALIGAHRLSARSLEGCAYYFMQEVRITVKAGDALIKCMRPGNPFSYARRDARTHTNDRESVAKI